MSMCKAQDISLQQVLARLRSIGWQGRTTAGISDGLAGGHSGYPCDPVTHVSRNLNEQQTKDVPEVSKGPDYLVGSMHMQELAKVYPKEQTDGRSNLAVPESRIVPLGV
ncbi:hypothetical protein AMATHDRAFT_4925 [Amanita thiersii Skay4041]|uniref:Uncharacterized protein n=1 Tax=Amanita thiersii Skay4041 TaxID=703135 RepID=A0A2A9NFM1_9AGAR|nr:hypothetical protein AMATHDRAFT_4925 [Amanita thiersii Skay4041]